jgi:NAD(P)H-dependent FMN reductase
MLYVPIIVGSVRRGRRSIRAARYILERLRRSGQMEAELLDLLEYNFPMLDPAFDRRAQLFVDELVWFATAVSAQRSREAALAGAPR